MSTQTVISLTTLVVSGCGSKLFNLNMDKPLGVPLVDIPDNITISIPPIDVTIDTIPFANSTFYGFLLVGLVVMSVLLGFWSIFCHLKQSRN